MEILGLSESTPKTEGRLKSLFWPSIQSGADVDYLGAQGYWVCTIVAVISLLFLLATGHPITALLTAIYFYVGGVGVRERNFFAAVIVFFLYFLSTILTLEMLFTMGGIVRIFISALLLSNVRATWLASQWSAGSEEAAMPPRFAQTLGDKFVDKLPAILWPKLRIAYYIFSIAYLSLTMIGLGVLVAKRIHG